MKRKLLNLSFLLLLGSQVFAQNITILYDATKGTSALPGATDVYMHSGGNDDGVPNDCWSCVIGNWGMDDGIGELTNVSGDLWTITIDAFAYYSAASGCAFTGTSISCIGMVFRSADGTATGKDNNDQDIFVNLSGFTPVVTQADGTPFDGVTVTVNTGINELNNALTAVNVYPTLASTEVAMNYNLNSNADVKISIRNYTGQVVKSISSEVQSAGAHKSIVDVSDLSNGTYFVSMLVDGVPAHKSFVVSR